MLQELWTKPIAVICGNIYMFKPFLIFEIVACAMILDSKYLGHICDTPSCYGGHLCLKILK